MIYRLATESDVSMLSEMRWEHEFEEEGNFDIPFEETLRRHKQKPNAHEFGEKEMREWWIEKDLLDIITEICLPKELSLNEIVDRIYQDVIK